MRSREPSTGTGLWMLLSLGLCLAAGAALQPMDVSDSTLAEAAAFIQRRLQGVLLDAEELAGLRYDIVAPFSEKLVGLTVHVVHR